jgi:hypothetical protein
MNPISHNNSSIKEDNEIDPKFKPFPNPENDNIENFQEIFDNMEEVSENMNFSAIANINQVEQNETQNEIQIELKENQDETHKEQNETQNEQNWQNEQNETLILSLNHKEIEDKRKEEKEAVLIPQKKVKNEIRNMKLPEDIFALEKNLVLNKLDDSLNSKVEDKLGNLYNCSKEINSFTYKYEEKKIPKKEGSSMEFLKKKRNSK